MKIIKQKLSFTELRLLYNVSAMLEISDRYSEDGIKSISEIVRPEGFTAKARFERNCEIAEIMSESAELYRRYMGYDAEEWTKAEALKIRCTPNDSLLLQTAIMQAIVEGMKQENEDEDEEIDLGLQEINQKKRKKKS